MKVLPIKITLQPPMQCGPACLKAVLSYYKVDVPISKLVEEARSRYKWHDWDFKLGLSALKRGLKVKIHTLSTTVFDPSWAKLSKKALMGKLAAELNYVKSQKKLKKRRAKWSYTTLAYEEKELLAALGFIRAGGTVDFSAYTTGLIEECIRKGTPIICSFNQQLLHKAARLLEGKADDVKGVPLGHIIVIVGFNNDKFSVADPGVWYSKSHYYWVDKAELLDSVVRWDGNLIAVSK